MVTPKYIVPFNWESLTQSISVEAMFAMLYSLPAPYDIESWDIRDWTFPDRMPLEQMRNLLDLLNIPSTNHLNQLFTRRVGTNLFTYAQRNSWQAVNRASSDLQFKYTYEWRHGDKDNASIPATRRTAIDFCISPSPLIAPTEAYARDVADWIRWALPYLEGAVDCVDGDTREGSRPRVQVSICSYSEVNLNLDMAFGTVTHILAR